MADSFKKLVLASSNAGKIREIREVLDGLPLSIVSSAELGLLDGAVEDGETYRDNALKKAVFYQSQTRLLTLAEDSGIVVDALAGELGVKTRRWGAGEKATDEAWIEYFLQVLEPVPDAQRTAQFVCCAVLLDEKGEAQFFEGMTKGVITRDLRAPLYPGLPISSCFIPEGFDEVYAALSVEEKNRVSHRGKALHQVRKELMRRGSVK